MNRPRWKPISFPCKVFVTCAPSLEELLLQELKSIGYEDTAAGYAGVYVSVHSYSDIYRLNYASRIGSRVLFPIAYFSVKNKYDLYDNALAIDWSRYSKSRQTFAIDSHVNHREFRNSLFAAQVVKDAICDYWRERTGDRPNVDTYNPDVQINLFIEGPKGVISIDTSGQPLHKRGYRLESGEAPLQETLAAAILYLTGYEAGMPLCDPCCGSGTFLIEAALMAANIPPGYLRNKWGFMNLPAFDQVEWLKVKNELDGKRVNLLSGQFFGADINKNAVRIAKSNVRAAGFDKVIDIVQSDVRDYKPSIAPKMIVTNPPYGLRLEETETLIPLYRALGDFMKRQIDKPGKGVVLTGSQVLAKEIGLATKQRHVIDNGGIPSRALEFEIW